MTLNRGGREKIKIHLDAGGKIAYNMGQTTQEVAEMARCAADTNGAMTKCAHSAPCRASFGFFMCSVLFSVLHFFGFSFFGGEAMPQGACV